MAGKHLIAGTAGHIDHGKTALIRALTGVDTDRLKEEKERGITIDLGFASSTISNDITLSWIDVPGHERFIGNMLAGAAGIDFVLLVIAATEGVMPQTTEHFEICRMLGVRHGVVALTKADLVDADGLDLATADARALIAGSFLEHADVIPVSSRTGQGLGLLREAILRLAHEVDRRPSNGNFRLPVDRAFVMKGFGTVATGTVFNGKISSESPVELLPAGKSIRVRAIQVHGTRAMEAVRGQRAALNLAGIEVDQVRRGDCLVTPGAFVTTREMDVELETLPTGPELASLAAVHFHTATTATVAKVRFHDRVRAAPPGSHLFARLLTEHPVVVLPGDHFILRRLSPLETIGGGVVLDNRPPRIRRKQEEGDKLKLLSGATPVAALNVFVQESADGCSLASLVPRMGLPEEELRILAKKSALRFVGAQANWLLTAEQLNANAERIQTTLSKFHSANPMLSGMPKEQLRAAVGSRLPDGFLDWVIAEDARFVQELEHIRLRVHKPMLSGAEAEASRAIENAFLTAKLQVPAVPEVLAQAGVNDALGRTILHSLIRQGHLVKVGQDLVFHKRNLGETIALLQDFRGRRFTVSEFKEWTGVSRKYAIPLLEFLDRQRITRRDGDMRTVL